MVRDTEVTKFIKQKISEIDMDMFSKPDESTPYDLQEYLMTAKISEIEEYISAIKNNKKSYEYSDNKKELKPKFKDVIDGLKKDVEKYKLYSNCLHILDNYNNREERINNRIGRYSVECDLNESQSKLLDIIDNTSLNDISCYDLTMITKYLVNNYDRNNISLLNAIFEFISSKYNGKKLREEDYIYINGLNHTIQHNIQMSNGRVEYKQHLKDWKSNIDKIISAYNKNKIASYDSRYDFIESIIDDKITFNKALTDFPDIINLRDKVGNPLSYNVMIKYLDAYFLELRGIESKIPKEYYLELYNKIISSPNYKISAVDEEEFRALHDCFVMATIVAATDNLKVVKELDEIDGLTNKK